VTKSSDRAATTDALPVDMPWLIRVLDGDVEIDVVPIEGCEPVGDGFRVSGRGRRFDAAARWRRAPTAVERWDVDLDVTLTDGAPARGGVVVAVRLAPVSEPQWLMPGLFYGENRPEKSRARYPRYGTATGGDPWTAGSWTFRADRAAIPIAITRDGQHTVGLATTELGPIGLNGLGFGLVDESQELRLAFPYREEPVAYDGSTMPLPADLPGHRWQPGETVRLAFSVYRDRAAPYGWVDMVEDHRRRLGEASPLRPWLDVEGAAALAAEGLLRWHHRTDPAVLVETASFARRDPREPKLPGERGEMHVAWLSGTPAAAALVAHGARTGDAVAHDAGTSVLDHIAANRAPCGTMWGRWTSDRGWTTSWIPGGGQLHSRTLGEATLFVGRAAAILEEHDGDARSWRDAAQSNLEFVERSQRADGAIPAAWDARTGDPTTWEGCAGLAWIPALIDGAAHSGRPSLIETARRAGTYYARFVEDERLYGAPEDVDLGPTSEDGYVAVMAYVALAESTEAAPARDRWLELARRSADWMLTFRYAWNVSFDPSTTLGALDYRTRGADQASPANQHLHVYGLVALPEMVTLARLTGERRYLDLTREHLAAARQLIARHDGDFGAGRGMMPERAYQTACFGPKGEIGPLSHAWCLGLLLWACTAAIDMPGLAEDAS
jgi:hypothetical protein